VGNVENKLGYSQHVISIVVLVLTLFSANLPISKQDELILKFLGTILFVVTIVYVTIVNLNLISTHLTSIQTRNSSDEINASPQSHEFLLIEFFSLITWLFLYIGSLIAFMFIFKGMGSFLLSHLGVPTNYQKFIKYWVKFMLYCIIIPVVAYMIVNRYVTVPLKEQIGIRVIYHPKDQLIIGESYDQPLEIIIKNVGNTEIEIKKLLVEFPERVTFRLKNQDFEKHVLTLNDVKKVDIPTRLVPKKQAHTNKKDKYKISLKIFPKYNPEPKEVRGKIYDYVLIHVETDKSIKPIIKYLDAVIVL